MTLPLLISAVCIVMTKKMMRKCIQGDLIEKIDGNEFLQHSFLTEEVSTKTKM